MFRSALAVLAVMGLAACDSATSGDTLTDAEVTADVAASSGDAIALDVSTLIGNESFGGLSGGPGSAPPLTTTRSRICYDQAGVVQTVCDANTTASMKISVAMTGAHTGEHFTGSVSRSRTDSISGLLGTETSRTHNGVGASHDTLSWTGDRGTRSSVEAATDSVIAIVFNLPRASNPWPASGRLVRNVSGSVTLTGVRQGTRSFTRRAEVIFPADAQGNVTLHLNDKTCNLNLVTRRVTACV